MKQKQVRGQCAVCGADFKPNRPTQRFCSSKCYGKANVTLVSVNCPYCGKDFPTNPFRLKATGKVFCSAKCRGAFMKRPAEERFWAMVNKDGPMHPHKPELGQCWLWTGTHSGNGYGGFNPDSGPPVPAHVFAWKLENGAVPPGLDVCHSCDVRRCVRLSHLFVGTRDDNMKDCVAKGRHAHGNKHGMAKITEQQVVEFRRRHAAGETVKQIHADSPLSLEATRACIKGTYWKHIQGPQPALEHTSVTLK